MSQLPPNLAGFKGGGAVITANIHCNGCGYSLTGLKTGDRCPECGIPIISRISGTGTSEFASVSRDALVRLSTASWLLSCGAALLFTGLLLALFAPLFLPGLSAHVPVGTIAAGAIAWIPGCWLLTQRIDNAPTYLSSHLALATRILSPAWGALALSLLVYHMLNAAQVATTPAAPPAAAPSASHLWIIALQSLPLLIAAAGIAGCVLTCMFAARIADWAEDDTTARRLRWGWLLAIVIGVPCVLLAVFLFRWTIMVQSSKIAFASISLVGFLSLICFFPIGVAAWSFYSLCSWAVISHDEKIASNERRARKLAERFKAPPTDG